jgi:5-methyltetrahydrofolate--homocysteine methyltransferase
MADLRELLDQRDWLLADGATGTNYFSMGLMSGDAPELWNADHPERVADLHKAFVDAGSDIILTNTFGGTRHRLALHRAQDRVAELNEKAARIARSVADGCDRAVVVAGSMGPTGELLEPVGRLSRDDAAAAFREQATALAAGGADVLWLETLSSAEELACAAAGAASTGLPFVATLSFDTNGSTMMGVSPADLAGLVRGLDPAPLAYGTNCGIGAAEVVACILAVRRFSGTDVLVAKANCGIPEFVDSEIRYNGTPDLMARYARLVRDAGARIIGGCCGTTPEHIAWMRAALVEAPVGEEPDLDAVTAVLGPVTSGARRCCSGSGWGIDERRARSGPRRRRRGPEGN